jgi:hypothetical protein
MPSPAKLIKNERLLKNSVKVLYRYPEHKKASPAGSGIETDR